MPCFISLLFVTTLHGSITLYLIMGLFTIFCLMLATRNFSLAVPVQQMCLVTDQIVSWEKHFTECPDTAMHIQLDTMMPLCPQTPLHPVYMNFLKLFKSVY